MSWNDFTDAEEQVDRGGIIPQGTIVKVILKVRPGGHDDPSQGWTGGLVTRNADTGSCYIDAEYTIIGGQYDKRKVWSLIGLHSPKGPAWGNSGRAFIRGALESARGVRPDDKGANAQAARRIAGLDELNGLTFAAKIEIEKGTGGYDDKNKIQYAVPVTHRDYDAVMAGAGAAPARSSLSAQAAATRPNGGGSKPAWAS